MDCHWLTCLCVLSLSPCVLAAEMPKAVKGAVAMDDVRLRTATEDELSRAYRAWRSKYPTRDLSPRPTDGANLALTVQKLEGGLDPDRPFLIWALAPATRTCLADVFEPPL